MASRTKGMPSVLLADSSDAAAASNPPGRSYVWLPTAFLVIAILVYIAVYTFLSAYKFDTFRQGVDLAQNEQTIWNTAHGRWFQTSLFGVMNYDFDDGPVPLELLLALPYGLLPTTYTLLFLQTVALAVGAVPIYLLAREKINPWVALLFAIAFLWHVSITRTNMYEFQFRSFVIPFFLLAFYFMERNSFRGFVLFSLLALSCKSEVALTLPFFGVYAWLTHRSLRWILSPIVMGVAWFVFVFAYVIPTFVPRDFITNVYGYGWMGNSVGSMVVTLLTRPLYVAQHIIILPKLEYIFQSLLLVLFLPLLKPRLLILALPNLAQNLLATSSVQYSVLYFYQPFVVATFFLAAIYGVAEVLPRLSVRRAFLAQFVASTLLLLASIYFNLTWHNLALRALKDPEPAGRRAAAAQILAQIPSNAPVAAGLFLAPHLAAREELSYFPGNNSYPFDPDKVQFVVLDLTIDNSPLARKRLAELRSDAAWEVVAQEDGFILLERRS